MITHQPLIMNKTDHRMGCFISIDNPCVGVYRPQRICPVAILKQRWLYSAIRHSPKPDRGMAGLRPFCTQYSWIWKLLLVRLAAYRGC